MEKRTEESILADIKEHPENHRHGFCELTPCCTVDGVLVLSLMDAHAEFVDLGTNGGTKCDVWTGPCACGAWHKIDAKGKRI
jgi:hypothetical protein